MDETDVWQRADLVTPMAIRVAATLRVADHLARAEASAADLSHAIAGSDTIAVDAEALDRLLRHLETVGLVERDQAGRFGLTAAGDCLRDDHESGIRRVLDIDGPLGRADRSFVHLLHSVQTGEAGFAVLYGHSFWDDLIENDARAGQYDALMAADVSRWAAQLVPAFDWGALGSLVDVGGGDGTLLSAILQQHGSLHGTVFEQPATAERARVTLRAAGVEDRAAVVAGSFFDPLPAGAGGYLLSAILHDWDDEAAGAILRRCADAAGADGRVLVVEKTGADGESPRTDMDLRMLVYFGGRERGVEALSRLGEHAGLIVESIHPAGDLSIIELS